MDVGLLEPRHRALAALTREAVRELEPSASSPADSELARQIARLGAYRYLVPARHGGVSEQVEARAICVLREELAYRSAKADSIFGSQGLGSHPILLAGSDDQREQFLPSVANGKVLFAFALTEPQAGSDVSALSCSARRQGGEYFLNGNKRFISNAGIATHYTLFARTAPGSKGVSAFIIPRDAPGLFIHSNLELLSEHPIGELELKECRVPITALIGLEGDGLKLAFKTLDVFRATVGAAAVGMARRALDEAVAYAQARQQFGAPLAALQGVQFLLAESAAELEAATLLVHRSAAVKDEGADRVSFESAVAKYFATEAAQRIIDRCLQIHGGNGLIKDSPMERLYRDIRGLRIYEGASEVQKVLIARHLLNPAGASPKS
jgi:acyl-CoA dehydrogenase